MFALLFRVYVIGMVNYTFFPSAVLFSHPIIYHITLLNISSSTNQSLTSNNYVNSVTQSEIHFKYFSAEKGKEKGRLRDRPVPRFHQTIFRTLGSQFVEYNSLIMVDLKSVDDKVKRLRSRTISGSPRAGGGGE